jgi:hypothetical protein
MTQEITAEQAPQIHDLESYKTVTKAKRFKRTAEEMKLGLTPEEALQRRLAAFDVKAVIAKMATQPPNPALVRANKRANEAVSRMYTSDQHGDIVIRIRPAKGVSPDYFEHLPAAEIVVIEDDKFYGWLDVFLSGRYHGTPSQFFTEALDQGLGELISHPHTETAAEPQEVLSSVNDNSTPPES